MEILLFAATSFLVGLSGALVPGPMLTVTISDSLKKGFLAGPLVVLGHFIAEVVLIILILAGLSWIIGSDKATLIIGTLGGVMLIYLGYSISKSSLRLPDSSGEVSKGEANKGEVPKKYGSVLGGILTSISNPYFFIWWATIGFAFMFRGLELAGIFGLLGFLLGHWSADLGWYSMVSFLTSRGSKIMNMAHYKIIMKVCGIFLVILGIYFVLNAANSLNSLI
jgi:threonine/homoserine/homoserine lactone efflux protein